MWTMSNNRLKRRTNNYERKSGRVIIGLAVVAGGIYAALSLTRVGQGEVGVVYSMNGGVQEETLSPGFHFVGPFDKV